MFSVRVGRRQRFPNMKGKAAQVKHLIPALLYAFRKLRSPGNPDHDSIELALQMSLTMDHILNDHPDSFVLPTEVAAEFTACCMVFLE